MVRGYCPSYHQPDGMIIFWKSLKRTHNTGLVVLIALLILCGIYVIYAYKVNTSNVEQARPTQGLVFVAHHLQAPVAPVLAPTQAPQLVVLSDQPQQQPVQQTSVLQASVDMKNWQDYVKKLHLPSSK